MRDEPIDRADDVRAFLERMAIEAPVVATVPRRVVRRARGRLAVTALAGTLVLVLAGYGAAAVVDVAREWNRSIPAEQRTSVPTPSTSLTALGAYDRGSAAGELSRYVLQTFEGPKVAPAFYFNGGQTWEVHDMAPTFDIAPEDLLRAGLVDAYVTLWTTPDWGAGTGKDLLSVALLFDSPSAAHEGFALFDIKGTWHRWRWLPPRGLGEEAVAAQGLAHGKASVAYVWRFDDLVLVVASQGSLSPRVVASLADQMQARVDRFHPAS